MSFLILSDIQDKLDRLKKVTMGSTEAIGLLSEVAVLAIDHLEGTDERKVKEVARTRYRWPVVRDLFKDSPQRIDEKLAYIDFAKNFPIKSGIKSDQLRLWIARKLEWMVVIKERGPSPAEVPVRMPWEWEKLEEYILACTSIDQAHSNEIAGILMFWYLMIESDTQDFFELEFGCEEDEFGPVAVGLEYSEIVKGKVSDRARALARRVIQKRLDRAKASLRKELKAPTQDHKAKVYDLEEKIGKEEALLKKQVAESSKNVGSAFLEILQKELEGMLPAVDP